MSLLVVDHVIKSHAGNPVLHGGPSGCGKTTLLNCIGGVDKPDSGAVKLADRDLAKLDADALTEVRRRSLGTVFQFFHLLPTLTAAENMELPLKLTAVPADERKARVQALLERVGLKHRAEALPGEMSGGEMQRVAIARALIHRPQLLLADEPTGNLDSDTGAKILSLLKELSEEHGTALLMVTHSEEAAATCHRVLRMRDGRISDG